jgi:hypothetical protein
VATRPPRRTARVRRASAGLSPVRAGALLVLLLAAASIYGVANSSAFRFEAVRIEGATYTPSDDVEAALDGVRGQNLFVIRTAPLEAEVASLRTVRAATISVRLPDTLVVDVAERVPILVWQVGARRYLADVDGNLFARLEDDAPEAAERLPVVEDRRAASAGLSVGSTLAAVDLDAARRLASLVPADVGSGADGLTVLVNDTSGFVVRAQPIGWAAVFGFYTANLRTPELIPGQVRLLRSLLVGREPLVERVILASETDGTYIPRPAPDPTPTAEP